MKRTHLLLIAALCLPCVAGGPDDRADWRGFRGPDGTGFAPGSRPPVEWSEQRNIRWKVEIPGQGHASPIVLGDRVYVMTAVATDRVAEPASGEASPPASTPADGERGARGQRAAPPTNVHEFRVLALDRTSGSVAWSTTVREEVPHEGTHDTGSLAAASPITDGERLYAFFGSRGLYCLDLAGRVAWEKDLGDMETRNSFGEGASPALHGETLVVPWDHERQSFVVALDARTGDEKWRVDRDEPSSWTTPIVVEVGGAPQAILAGSNATIAYDLATGAEIWRCSGLTRNVIPTPIAKDGIVYLTSGFRGQALQAIRLAGAAGDLTGTGAIIWSHDRGTPYVPSPLLLDGKLYFLQSNSAVISCLDAATGEPHYAQERLENVGNVYASPVGAASHVYVCGREGEMVVLKDGPTLEVVATNHLGQGIDATPAIAGDELYVRGSKHLFCIAETKPTVGE